MYGGARQLGWRLPVRRVAEWRGDDPADLSRRPGPFDTRRPRLGNVCGPHCGACVATKACNAELTLPSTEGARLVVQAWFSLGLSSERLVCRLQGSARDLLSPADDLLPWCACVLHPLSCTAGSASYKRTGCPSALVAARGCVSPLSHVFSSWVLSRNLLKILPAKVPNHVSNLSKSFLVYSLSRCS